MITNTTLLQILWNTFTINATYELNAIRNHIQAIPNEFPYFAIQTNCRQIHFTEIFISDNHKDSYFATLYICLCVRNIVRDLRFHCRLSVRDSSYANRFVLFWFQGGFVCGFWVCVRSFGWKFWFVMNSGIFWVLKSEKGDSKFWRTKKG